jgi:uncharacterized membrane protein
MAGRFQGGMPPHAPQGAAARTFPPSAAGGTREERELEPMNSPHYLPVTPGFFSLLVGILVVLTVVIQVGALRYAYMRLGLGRGGALALLVGSLVGSYFNVPVAEVPGQPVTVGAVVDFFGMQYPVPVMIDRPGTLIAVNVGGAVIPACMSLYLLARYRLWLKGAIATAGVAAFIHWMATPVPGLGIAVPVFAPALGAAVGSLLLARERAAPLAYVTGSLGTLIGADLLNIDKIADLGAPVASIGGAGTFDGIFLTGILAVLLASFYAPPEAEKAA